MRNKFIVDFVLRLQFCGKVGANGIAYTNPLEAVFIQIISKISHRQHRPFRFLYQLVNVILSKFSFFILIIILTPECTV
jgi:hypothetical protein